MSQKFFPGKVLIVDDNFSTEIEKLIIELSKKGFTTQYWDSKGDFYKNISAVRILILDLDLAGASIPRGNPAFYAAPAEILKNIDGPYIVIIYAIDFIDEDIKNLKEFYESVYGPFEGYIAGIKGLSKGEDIDKIFKLIDQALKNKDIFKLILTWEKILEKAKDDGLSKFVKEKFAKEMTFFVKTLGNDVGINSLPREFIASMMRFLSRYMHRGQEYEELTKILNSISKGPSVSISEPLLQHRNMFFTPSEKEKVWTGDIFRIENLGSVNDEKKYWKYKIILTPVCNIAQDNSETYFVCDGFPLDYTSLIDQDNHPLLKRNNITLPPYGGNDEEYAKKLENKFKKKFKNRFHFLWNFSEVDDKYFGLCFDFQKAKSISTKYFVGKKTTRICRLDSPFIDEMLQKFGNYSSRIGTPEVNKPHVSPP